jgi:hypothetical protein
MRKIRARFIERINAVEPSGGGVAEAAKLWKNKPHPMRLFSARSQFFQRDLGHR